MPFACDFTCDGGRVRQVNAPPDATPVVSVVDLTSTPQHDQCAAIEAAAATLQEQLNLTSGPLMRAALFELGETQPQRLLIVVHHLAVDGVSWRILLEDLAHVCRQSAGDADVLLPPKTTSFKRWAERLQEYVDVGGSTQRDRVLALPALVRGAPAAR